MRHDWEPDRGISGQLLWHKADKLVRVRVVRSSRLSMRGMPQSNIDVSVETMHGRISQWYRCQDVVPHTPPNMQQMRRVVRP